MGFTLDPEVQTGLMAMMGGAPPPPPAKVGDVESRRQMIAGMFAALAPAMPADITTKDYSVPVSDGQSIRCRLYKKQNAPEGGSGVLYLHGGGYISGDIDMYNGVVGKYVEETGVPFFSAEYRLAPEVKYPGNVDDSHKALLFMVEHAAEFGIDPKKIAIMGDSAGGGMTAALLHYNLEKNGPAIAKQILIYPMLDDRNVDPDPAIDDIAVWKADDNRTGWDGILGSSRGAADLKPSAAPARMTIEQAAKLPATYIDCGDMDIFRDEDIDYAKKLVQAGVSCELHIYPGCTHGFELTAPQANVSQRAFQNRFQAIRTIVPVGGKEKL
ncbi:uncharacterized protein PV09_00043 [Verruconis gallopava]|uniref:Alpha/beta hydrolase fold-3 domain-containing protein n=1 Tax=Verruconis gallopava TaxID=253628 RepID=A0A0D2AQY6_9PEZI|nr:uncharacterized protein PV09_00043 [Verruconis gallopava]KIW09098.1 hypothetical protein PV09_00043 [Verruconis gallopava]